jgi:spore germination protein
MYNHVSAAGYKVFVSFTIRVFQVLSGTIFSNLDYDKLSKNVDKFIFMSYEFGSVKGIPPGTASLDSYRRFFKSTTIVIPPEKILAGMSVIGYVWEYPYVPGKSKVMAVSYNSAMELASINNAEIAFDETTNTAYFQYISDEEYIVRFWDARSIDKFMKTIPEVGLNGISSWNIMTWFPQIWLVINAQYDIIRV